MVYCGKDMCDVLVGDETLDKHGSAKACDCIKAPSVVVISGHTNH